jgi:hypothetical protein
VLNNLEAGKMTREFEFSPKVKAELAYVAQFRCVRPGCNKVTHLYDQTQGKWVHFGAGSHDAPAGTNEGGLRSDNDMTPEQKKAYGNGAWLCRNCSTLVDIAQHYFPLGTLPQWQSAAGHANTMAAYTPVQASHINFSEAVARAQHFLDLTKNVRFEGRKDDPVISVPSRHAINTVLQKAIPLIPMNEYSSLFPHTVNVQMRMVENLIFIRREIDDRSAWHTSGGYFRCNPTFGVSPAAVGVQASRSKVSQLIEDYYTAREHLQQFVLGKIDFNLLYLW